MKLSDCRVITDKESCGNSYKLRMNIKHLPTGVEVKGSGRFGMKLRAELLEELEAEVIKAKGVSCEPSPKNQ